MENEIKEMLVGKKAVSLQKEITDLICYHTNAQRIFKLAKSINPSVAKSVGFCAAVIHILVDDDAIRIIKKQK